MNIYRETYDLERAIPTINSNGLELFETIKLRSFQPVQKWVNLDGSEFKLKPMNLRRCPTRMSEYIGKYSFYYHYDDMLIPGRICVLDYGMDLYETPRGRRRLYREIRKDGATVHVSF